MVMRELYLIPPYWIKEKDEETIVDKICKYSIERPFDEALKRVTIVCELVRTMIHFPIEIAFAHLLLKKFPNNISELIGELSKYGLTDSKSKESFSVNEKQFKINIFQKYDDNTSAFLINYFGMRHDYIGFLYNEYNMFFCFKDYNPFSRIKSIIYEEYINYIRNRLLQYDNIFSCFNYHILTDKYDKMIKTNKESDLFLNSLNNLSKYIIYLYFKEKYAFVINYKNSPIAIATCNN